MYNVYGKLFNGIKSMYANSLACVRVKGGESKWFRINNGVRHSMYIDSLACVKVKGGESEWFRIVG